MSPPRIAVRPRRGVGEYQGQRLFRRLEPSAVRTGTAQVPQTPPSLKAKPAKGKDGTGMRACVDLWGASMRISGEKTAPLVGRTHHVKGLATMFRVHAPFRSLSFPRSRHRHIAASHRGTASAYVPRTPPQSLCTANPLLTMNGERRVRDSQAPRRASTRANPTHTSAITYFITVTDDSDFQQLPWQSLPRLDGCLHRTNNTASGGTDEDITPLHESLNPVTGKLSEHEPLAS